MENTDVDLLGISEMKWTVMEHFTSGEHDLFFVDRRS